MRHPPRPLRHDKVHAKIRHRHTGLHLLGEAKRRGWRVALPSPSDVLQRLPHRRLVAAAAAALGASMFVGGEEEEGRGHQSGKAVLPPLVVVRGFFFFHSPSHHTHYMCSPSDGGTGGFVDYESEKRAWHARRVEEVQAWQRHYHMEPRADSKLTQLYASGVCTLHPAEVARELVCTEFLYRRTLYGELLEDFLRCVADGLRRECEAQTGCPLSWTATWNIVRFYGPIALKLMCVSSSGLYMPEHLPDPREEERDGEECG